MWKITAEVWSFRVKDIFSHWQLTNHTSVNSDRVVLEITSCTTEIVILTSDSFWVKRGTYQWAHYHTHWCEITPGCSICRRNSPNAPKPQHSKVNILTGSWNPEAKVSQNSSWDTLYAMWKYLTPRGCTKGEIHSETMEEISRLVGLCSRAPPFPQFNNLSVTLMTCHQMNIETTCLIHELWVCGHRAVCPLHISLRWLCDGFPRQAHLFISCCTKIHTKTH